MAQKSDRPHPLAGSQHIPAERKLKETAPVLPAVSLRPLQIVHVIIRISRWSVNHRKASRDAPAALLTQTLPGLAGIGPDLAGFIILLKQWWISMFF